MACRLVRVKPLSETILYYYELDPQEQGLVKLCSKLIFSQEYTLKNVVWEMTAILSQPQGVKRWIQIYHNDVIQTNNINKNIVNDTHSGSR